MADQAPIGIFDSGIGGLTILKAIQDQLPGEALLYVADQAHVPYGSRSLEQVRNYAHGITRFLLDQEVKLVVVACNTASAAALHELRRSFPGVSFVGMEPAVKPAVESTESGVIGVLATPATFQGALYASLVERFAQEVTVLQDTCPGLVEQIEKGDLDCPETNKILEQALQPMLEQGADSIVLGCTHYPYAIPQIKTIVGPQVRVIDPAPAIARQTARLLETQVGQPQRAQSREKPRVEIYTSGTPTVLQLRIHGLLGFEVPIRALHWDGEILRPCN